MKLAILQPKAEKEKQLDTDALVRYFEDSAEAAKRGEITKVLALVEKQGFYEHTRIGFTYEQAVGMVHRMSHLLMRDWDKG